MSKLLILSFLVACGSDSATDDFESELVGSWRACTDGLVLRSLEISKGHAHVTNTTYQSNSDCSGSPSVRVVQHMDTSLDNTDDSAIFAVDATYLISTVTPLSEASANTYNMSQSAGYSDWEKDVAKDVTGKMFFNGGVAINFPNNGDVGLGLIAQDATTLLVTLQEPGKERPKDLGTAISYTRVE